MTSLGKPSFDGSNILCEDDPQEFISRDNNITNNQISNMPSVVYTLSKYPIASYCSAKSFSLILLFEDISRLFFHKNKKKKEKKKKKGKKKRKEEITYYQIIYMYIKLTFKKKFISKLFH